MPDLPTPYLDALLWFREHPEVPAADLPPDIPLSTALYLVSRGCLSYHAYDPNLRYLLPADQQDGMWLFLTKEGEAICLSMIHQAKQEADQRANEDAVRNAEQQLQDKRSRKDARRSWCQFVIGAIIQVIIVLLSAFLAKNTSVFDWLEALFTSRVLLRATDVPCFAWNFLTFFH